MGQSESSPKAQSSGTSRLKKWRSSIETRLVKKNSPLNQKSRSAVRLFDIEFDDVPPPKPPRVFASREATNRDPTSNTGDSGYGSDNSAVTPMTHSPRGNDVWVRRDASNTRMRRSHSDPSIAVEKANEPDRASQAERSSAIFSSETTQDRIVMPKQLSPIASQESLEDEDHGKDTEVPEETEVPTINIAPIIKRPKSKSVLQIVLSINKEMMTQFLTKSKIYKLCNFLKSRAIISNNTFAQGNPKPEELVDYLRTIGDFELKSLLQHIKNEDLFYKLSDKLEATEFLLRLALSVRTDKKRLLKSMLSTTLNETGSSWVLVGDLSSINLRNAGAMQISTALQKFKCIQSLSLGANEITKEGVYQIAKALFVNTSLQELDLRLNQFGDRGLSYIIDALSVNRTLNRLVISCSGITQAGCQSICNILPQTEVKHLDMSYNELGSGSLGNIVEVLNSSKLTSLRFRNVGLGLRGLDKFATALGTSTLKDLDLSNNDIGDEAIVMLSTALSANSYLERLYLEGCTITAKGCVSLLKSLKSNAVVSLDLSGNPLANSGAIVVAKQLTYLSNLRELDFGNCEIGNSGLLALLEGCQRNSSLRQIRLAHNLIGVLDDGPKESMQVSTKVIESEVEETKIVRPELKILLFGNKL